MFNQAALAVAAAMAGTNPGLMDLAAVAQAAETSSYEPRINNHGRRSKLHDTCDFKRHRRQLVDKWRKAAKAARKSRIKARRK